METSISLIYPTIFNIGPLHVTNTVLGSFVTTLLVILIMWMGVRKVAIIPNRMQVFCEMIITTFLGFCKDAYGSEARARKYLPLYITLFLFLLVANQFSVLPIITNIVYTPPGAEAAVPLLKISPADFSQTVTLGLTVVLLSHIIALTINPVKHVFSYIKIDKLLKVRSPGDFANWGLDQFIGMMDIIGEFSKVISISARLFGNIFAGEVMGTVITGLIAYVAPMPFVFLGMFSGIVQAFVFAILSIQFMSGVINNVAPAPAKEPELIKQAA